MHSFVYKFLSVSYFFTNFAPEIPDNKVNNMNLKLLIVAMAATLMLSCSQERGETEVIVETTMGTIELKLYNETPKHRDNFISLANESYFDSLLFHRVIPDFMIQGGDPDSKYAPAGARLGEGGPGYLLNAEIRPGLIHKRGALAAAREGDEVNPAKMSSPCQFYIAWGKVYEKHELQALVNLIEERTGRKMELTTEQATAYTTVGGIPHLDGEYTVFGEVTKGLEVVDKIQNVERDKYDRPLTDVRILKVTVKEK